MSNALIKTILISLVVLLVMSCSKREEAIVNANYGNAVITTFTVDSLLFSVYLNGDPLTENIASPVATELKRFPFYDTVAHLQVYEKSNQNRVIVDTNIHVHVGFNFINIVQLNRDQKPFLPAPPAEPLPPAGYCKVKLVYTAPPGVPFLDSVKCVLRIDTSTAGNGSGTHSVDTLTLSRYQFSDQYYVVKKSTASFRVRVYDPVTNIQIQETSFENASDYTDFNTVDLKAFKNASSFVIYELERVF